MEQYSNQHLQMNKMSVHISDGQSKVTRKDEAAWKQVHGFIILIRVVIIINA